MMIDQDNDGDNVTASADTAGANDASVNKPPGNTAPNSFIAIKEVNVMSRGRTLRLQAADIIIAINGEAFHGTIEELLDELDEADPEEGFLMSLWREGIIFSVVVRGPLGCVFEYASPEDAEKASQEWSRYAMPPLDDFVMYEVLKDIHRKCDIIDTRTDPLGYLMPPFWLIQKQLGEPLVALIMIYLVTFSVHWIMFVITAIILAVYFSRAQTALLRSFALYKEKQMWLILAATSEKEVQLFCRHFDPKCDFKGSQVGPPKEDEEKPRKKRRRSSVPG